MRSPTWPSVSTRAWAGEPGQEIASARHEQHDLQRAGGIGGAGERERLIALPGERERSFAGSVRGQRAAERAGEQVRARSQQHLCAGDLVDDLQVGVDGLGREDEARRRAGEETVGRRDRRARARLCEDVSAAQNLDADDLTGQQPLQRGAGAIGVAAVDRRGQSGRALHAMHRLGDVAAGGGLVVDARGDRAERACDRGGTVAGDAASSWAAASRALRDWARSPVVPQPTSETVKRTERSRPRRRLLSALRAIPRASCHSPQVMARGDEPAPAGLLLGRHFSRPTFFFVGFLPLLLLSFLPFLANRDRLGVQPRPAREGAGRAAVRAAEVERPGDRLGDDAFFEIRVGDRQQRVDARLGAELRADRELAGDRLVARLCRADAVDRRSRGFPPSRRRCRSAACPSGRPARRLPRSPAAGSGRPSAGSATAAGSR